MSRLIEIVRNHRAVVLVVVGVLISLLVIPRGGVGLAVVVGLVVGAALLAPSNEIVRNLGAVFMVVFCVPCGLVVMWLGFYATQYGEFDGPDPQGWIAFVAGLVVVVGSFVGAWRLVARAEDGERPGIAKPILLCIGWLILNVMLIGLGLALHSWPPIFAAASFLLGIPLIVAQVRLKVFWTAWAVAMAAALVLSGLAAWITSIGVIVVAINVPNSRTETGGSDALEPGDRPVGAEPPPD
jgi:hypothetical protein